MIRNPDAACYHHILTTAVGCDHVDRACKFCCVQAIAGKYWQFAEKGVTRKLEDGTYVWNGTLWIADPSDDEVWLKPQLIPGSGKFIFVNLMSDCFHAKIPTEIVRLGFWSIAASRHFGMFLTKRVERMAEVITAASAEEIQAWQPKSLLGFTAGTQQRFDQRWPYMRALAERGWMVFGSFSPLLELITPPPDYFELACWTIISGEQGPPERVRDMKPEWAGALLDSCDRVGMPFFFREMSSNAPIIPNWLLRRDFPVLKSRGTSVKFIGSPSPSVHLPKVPPLNDVGLAESGEQNGGAPPFSSLTGHRLINLRQTSAAGKTTIVRKLIERVGAEPLYGIFGQRQPEAVRILGARPLFAIGPYPAAGCDSVLSRAGVQGVIDLLQKYSAMGDVIFEGLIISSMFGAIGEWLAARKSQVIIAVLDVTLDDCRVGLAARQGDNQRAAKSQETHYHRTLKVAERMREMDMAVEMLKREGAVETILGWLK